VVGWPSGVEHRWMGRGASRVWGGARGWVNWAGERSEEANTGGVLGDGPSGRPQCFGQFFTVTRCAGEDPWLTTTVGARGGAGWCRRGAHGGRSGTRGGFRSALSSGQLGSG
jgi:hypothetical protein